MSKGAGLSREDSILCYLAIRKEVTLKGLLHHFRVNTSDRNQVGEFVQLLLKMDEKCLICLQVNVKRPKVVVSDIGQKRARRKLLRIVHAA
jgi:hypothetical protein